MKKLITLFGLIASILALGIPDVYAKNYSKKQLRNLAKQVAERHGADVSLIFAIIKQESNWNSKVISSAGAIGLMQIMPATGKSFCGLSKKELFNPSKNIDCGVRYFIKQFSNFGSVKLALCAYNAGPGRVRKLGRCPTYKETINYVHRIMTAWNGGRQNRVAQYHENPNSTRKKPRQSMVAQPSTIVEYPNKRSSTTRREQRGKHKASFCKIFPSDDSCKSGKYDRKPRPSRPVWNGNIAQSRKKSSLTKTRGTHKALYCNYFPDSCIVGNKRKLVPPSKIVSMPQKKVVSKGSHYQLFCKYFSGDSVCR